MFLIDFASEGGKELFPHLGRTTATTLYRTGISAIRKDCVIDCYVSIDCAGVPLADVAVACAIGAIYISLHSDVAVCARQSGCDGDVAAHTVLTAADARSGSAAYNLELTTCRDFEGDVAARTIAAGSNARTAIASSDRCRA